MLPGLSQAQNFEPPVGIGGVADEAPDQAGPLFEQVWHAQDIFLNARTGCSRMSTTVSVCRPNKYRSQISWMLRKAVSAKGDVPAMKRCSSNSNSYSDDWSNPAKAGSTDMVRSGW